MVILAFWMPRIVSEVGESLNDTCNPDVMEITIIDPDTEATEALTRMLRDYGLTASITHLCSAPGITVIDKDKPDFIFLDIDVLSPKALKVAQKFFATQTEVILISRFKEMAMQAFEWDAFDFLLKPFSPGQIRKVSHKIAKWQPALAQADPRPLSSIKKVSVPVTEGFRFVLPSMVIHCEADANFTWIFLENGEKLITCRLLREMEDKFSEKDFIKVHRSHLVNLNKVDAILRNDGWELVLCNGRHVPVARERKDAVMKALGLGA